MIIDHRYEVIENLGSGAWSNVYKVVDKRTGTTLVLKLFQYLSSADLYDKFTAEEMHHVSKIEHPNLIHVIDFGHVGDHIYIVYDYFDGISLKQFKFQKRQIELLYDIITQIVYALEALHTQDIIHKDLKPENILYKISKHCAEVKVIDYGFAKIDPKKDQQSITGSLPYIAPEIYQNKQPTKQSDYYSLGVLLYKVTTGNFPFSIEQINSLITGYQQYFIPKFPSELNNNIPKPLEKFIIRLLERDSRNRFESGEDIINYINRIQSKQYPFSIEWSLVNKLKFNSYISRESYCHQILEYIGNVENNNGKIITLIGSDGQGKDSILSLLRYHLLNNKYFLFDYTCTKQDHEPFFALIKEFMLSLTEEEIKKYDSLLNISQKFKKYLYESVSEAKRLSQNQEELRADFESVKSILLNLSKVKPIIFIIRRAQFVHKHTVDFINYISPFITTHRVLIVLGFNEYQKITHIIHPVIIQIKSLTLNEATQYINKVLETSVHQEYAKVVWDLSAGNPLYVKEILIDHVQKKYISKDMQLSANIDFENYKLPLRITNSMLSRVSHIDENKYEQLKSLSIIETPMNKDLISYVLKLYGKALYDFIYELLYNDLLVKHNQNYRFNFVEVKKKLFNETDIQLRMEVSKSVLIYYIDKSVYDIDVCQGLIQNAIMANDIKSQRDFSYKLFELYNEQFDQDSAFQTIIKVLILDFNPKLKHYRSILINDLSVYQEKVELLGYQNKSDVIVQGLKSISSDFTKYLILGTIDLVNEDFKEAIKHINKASNFIVTGIQQIQIWLKYTQIYNSLDIVKVPQYLDSLSKLPLLYSYKLQYIERLSEYYKQKGEILKAIGILEEFFSSVKVHQDSSIMLKLSSLHNTLGVCYSINKNIEEADEHLNTALSIWKRYNVKRNLCLVYNNIADLHLKQGFSVSGISFARKSYEIAYHEGFEIYQAKALLSIGEALIKQGDFIQAEKKLYEVMETISLLKNIEFTNSVIVNIALAKSKIKNFDYYYSFISEQAPKLLEGVILEINPLVKTYIYFLYELGLVKKLQKLLSKNTHINYQEIHESEFYYNTQSLISILNNDYEQSIEYLKAAVNYASEVKNHYAITVFYISEIECYTGIKEYDKAKEVIVKAKELIELYNYNYWRLKIKYLCCLLDSFDTNIPLRKIIRDLMRVYKETIEFEYYILRNKISLLILKLLLCVNADVEANKWFNQHKANLNIITNNLSSEYKDTFLKHNLYYSTSQKEVSISDIPSRYGSLKSKWNDLQYNLLSVDNADRIKFFIDKGINEIISPIQYQILIYSDKQKSYSLFLGSDTESRYLMTPEVYLCVENAYKSDKVIVEEFDNVHHMLVPLQIKSHKIGFMIISDQGELNFTKLEIAMIKVIKQHISMLIMRIQDYSEISYKIKMMNKLMNITHFLLRIVDIKTLEQEIISSCIDFTGSSRGFFIKKDDIGNYIYQVSMDINKTPLSHISVISKTALSECQLTKSPILTYNALEDNRFKNSISVQDYKIHSIFCAPVIVNESIYGFIYLDNYLDNTSQMMLNPEITTLLIDQISVAVKNTLQYEALMKKSIEMQSLDSIKDEFISIVSHELNTPLTTLQGYVSKLKRNIFEDEDDKQETIKKLDTQLKKMSLTISDILTMNKYNLITKLPKSELCVEEIINIIFHEVEIVSKNRKMNIKVEISKDLPSIYANWEALHRMIYNVVLNAIRFTRDFGTIIIGARHSMFPKEKVNNRNSLVIYIQDNGIGIPEYQVKFITNKFYELNEIYAHKSGSIEYKSSGLGLGLAISKKIAELHNGQIWIESKENEGTIVFISIPFKSS